MRDRGTTIRISYTARGQRQQRWGAFWNEYPYGPGTKPRQKTAFFATEAEAEDFKRLTLEALAAKNPAAPVQPPANKDQSRLDGFLDAWLEDHIKPLKAAATWRSYKGLVTEYITPHLGTLKVTDAGVTTLKIRSFYEQLYKQDVALPTRRHVHSCLSSALSYAQLTCHVINTNPALRLGMFLRHKEEQDDLKPDPNPLTVAEVKLFLEIVKANEAPVWYGYFLFLVETGIRIGEAASLKWDNIDLDAKKAEIEESFSPSELLVKRAEAKAAGTRGMYTGKDATGEKDTKTHQNRLIDLSTKLVEWMEPWRAAQREDAFKRGRKVPVYGFTNSRGNPIRQDGHLYTVFNRTMAAVEEQLRGTEQKDVRGRRRRAVDLAKKHTPHDLRDTFASTHLSADWGMLGWVSRMLGHASPVTTEEHYFKFRPTAATAGYADRLRSSW